MSMSTPPTQTTNEDLAPADDAPNREPLPQSTSTPAPDIHDTPMFRQLIEIIREQKDVMQGMKRSLERLDEKTESRPLVRGIDAGP